MSEKHKPPTLAADCTYSLYGRWKNDFSAFLSSNEIYAFSSLDVNTMPVSYPVPADPSKLS